MIEFTVYLINGDIETFRVKESMKLPMMNVFNSDDDVYDYSYKEVIA